MLVEPSGRWVRPTLAAVFVVLALGLAGLLIGGTSTGRELFSWADRSTTSSTIDGSAAGGADPTNLRIRSVSSFDPGFGNRVDVPLVPTTAPPHGVTVDVRADGVHIGIPPQAMQSEPDQRLQYWYQVTRTNVPPGAGAPDLVGEVPAVGQENVIDKNFEWEKQYAYIVTPITWVETQPNGKRIYSVPGESAQPIEVVTKDVFPPAVPIGLQAVYSAGEQKTIDLTWAPNTDADLAGYNVYRGGQKVNTELVKTPTYRDPVTTPGEYTYAVTAVDLRGNESAKSVEASEKAPE